MPGGLFTDVDSVWVAASLEVVGELLQGDQVRGADRAAGSQEDGAVGR
jgi:hypothetical protein